MRPPRCQRYCYCFTGDVGFAHASIQLKTRQPFDTSASDAGGLSTAATFVSLQHTYVLGSVYSENGHVLRLIIQDSTTQTLWSIGATQQQQLGESAVDAP